MQLVLKADEDVILEYFVREVIDLRALLFICELERFGGAGGAFGGIKLIERMEF